MSFAFNLLFLYLFEFLILCTEEREILIIEGMKTSIGKLAA